MLELLRKIKNRFLTGLYRCFIYTAFRLKVIYEDPDQKQSVPQGIYISNHMSHLDGLLIRAVFRKNRMYSVVTSEWMDKRWARALLFYEDCIPVDRENPGTGWIHEARRAVREGSSISIFPEGHTSGSEEMDEFKPGFLLLLAMLKNIPVIPVASCGKYRFLFGERKKVLVGKPVYIDRKRLGDQEGLDECASQFRRMIADMKARLREM